MPAHPRVLATPVRAFVIINEDAAGFPGLRGFSCGDPAAQVNADIARAVREINEIAGRLFSGKALEQRVILLEENAGGAPGEGELVGFCGVRHLPVYGQQNGGYINALGTRDRYRGYRVKKNKPSSPGSRLIAEALAQIKVEFGGGPMPYVWAAVKEGNRPSVELFRRHNFIRPPLQYPGGTMIRQGEAGGIQVVFT